MKKSLLALAAMSIMASSASAMYIVGSPAGEWGPDKGVEMKEVSEGWQWTGTIGNNDYFCFATDLTSDPSDWETFNTKYRLAPESKDLLASIGEYTLVAGVDRSFKGCGELCTYTVSKDGDSYKLTVSTPQDEIPNTPLYVFGAPAGEWNTSVGIEMERVADGWKWTATVDRNDYFCFATQLEEDPDAYPDDPGAWGHFNSNYRLSPEENDTDALPGVYTLCKGSQGNAFRGIGIECTFFVMKDEDSYTLSVSSNEEVPSDLLIKSMGVIGGFNGWASDVEMTKLAPNVWTASMNELDGDFKFRANGAWDINYGGADSPTSILGEGSLPIYENGGNFYVNNAKDITFILDIPNGSLFTKLNSTKATPLALRGSINNWEWQAPYCLFETEEEGVYSITLPYIEAGSQFKIANSDWGWQYSSDNTNMMVGEEYALVGNGMNMAFEESLSDVTIILNTKKDTLKATVAGDGVADLSESNKESFYFNLQGAKVEKSTKGVLIRVTGGKAEKVIIK